MEDIDTTINNGKIEVEVDSHYHKKKISLYRRTPTG
jgi:hypothetical protein